MPSPRPPPLPFRWTPALIGLIWLATMPLLYAHLGLAAAGGLGLTVLGIGTAEWIHHRRQCQQPQGDPAATRGPTPGKRQLVEPSDVDPPPAEAPRDA